MKDFSLRLRQWYAVHQRDLPWRNTRDPYRIWLSEIILQQTRVAQGLPYYERFLSTLPDVQAFAAAPQETILRLWQGLGYYSRARNMHHTANTIVTEYNGQFPDNFKELGKLKGVGPYTAAAIASFAFQEPVAVVDGNVYRVLARIFGIRTDIQSGKGKKEFAQLAQSLISEEHPDIHNQAIMELGAVQCTPKKPACSTCPFQQDCIAHRDGTQSELPVKTKKANVRTRYFHYLVFRRENEVLMKERPSGDIWQGLYDFFLLESAAGWLPEKQLQEVCPSAALEVPSPIFKHQLSHQQLWVRFWQLEVADLEVWRALQQSYKLKKLSAQAVEAAPKPILIKKYLDNLKLSLF